jgi:hypothetical protein
VNQYLAKLRGLTGENPHPREPSKPSKPSFEGFEGDPNSPSSGGDIDFEQPYYHALVALRSECPELVESKRWQQAIGDAHSFLDQWNAQAQAFGWTARELFEVHPTAPLSRLDHMGLIWLLRGRPVIVLTSTEADHTLPQWRDPEVLQRH